jgi:tetratricopeptide (TPR) repeat protein
MAAIQLPRSQFYTLDKAVVLSAKPDGNLVVKTYDPKGVLLSRTVVASQDLSAIDIPVLIRDPIRLLSALRERGLITQESPSQAGPSIQEDIQRLISQRSDESVPTLGNFRQAKNDLATAHLATAKASADAQEYPAAIDSFRTAFQFTNSPSDYANLPSLYVLMGDQKKASLAYLYLALYLVQARNIPDAIEALENCRKIDTDLMQVHAVLARLYFATSQVDKGVQFALQTAQGFTRQHPTEAAHLYRLVLGVRPDQWDAYEALSQLVQDPHEKAHVLLTGICFAVQREQHEEAKRLSDLAHVAHGGNFYSHLIVPRDGSALLDCCEALAAQYQRDGNVAQQIKALRTLVRIDQDPAKNAARYQQIIAGYESLNKPEKALRWQFDFLLTLVKAEDWARAEQVAQALLTKAQSPSQQIPLYQALRTIYTAQKSDKLVPILQNLGKAYLGADKTKEAEEVLKEAFSASPTFTQAQDLAQAQKALGKMSDCVGTLFEAAVLAQVEEVDPTETFREIYQIDPKLRYLNTAQKAHLIAQRQILNLTAALKESAEREATLRSVVETLSSKLESAGITQASMKLETGRLNSALASLDSVMQARLADVKEDVEGGFLDIRKQVKEMQTQVAELRRRIDGHTTQRSEDLERTATQLTNVKRDVASGFSEVGQQIKGLQTQVAELSRMIDGHTTQRSEDLERTATQLSLILDQLVELKAQADRLAQLNKAAQDRLSLVEARLPAPAPVAAPAALPAVPVRPAIAFGAPEWKQFLGDVGVEPLFPANIDRILKEPCPFDPSRTVEQTHALILMPATINRQPVTLNLLRVLTKKPKPMQLTADAAANGVPIQFNEMDPGFGDKALITRSHWVLVFKEMIPGLDPNQTFSNHQDELRRRSTDYHIANSVEASAAVLSESTRVGWDWFRAMCDRGACLVCSDTITNKQTMNVPWNTLVNFQDSSIGEIRCLVGSFNVSKYPCGSAHNVLVIRSLS